MYQHIYQFRRQLPVMVAVFFILALAVGLFTPASQLTAQTINSLPASDQHSHLHSNAPAGLADNDPLGAATNWHQGCTLIMTRHTEFASIQEAREFLESKGARIAIISPPAMLGWVPRQLAPTLIGKHGIEFIAHDPIELTTLRSRGKSAVEMATFFNKVVSGKLAQEAAEALTIQGAPLVNDAFEAPPLDQAAYQKNLQKLGIPASIMGNSDSMTGTVAICLFFVESNGTINPNNYTWNATDEQNVINQTYSGLSWWSNQATLYGTSVTFSVYAYRSTTSAVTQTGYEPILHPSSDDYLWITQIMTNLGYTSGSHFTRVTSFNTWLKGYAAANWAYSVFIGYNPPPAPSTFTDSKFAYAYYGGPYMQTLYNNGGNNFEHVLAHESGHIFWACDEYYGGCTSCGACTPNTPRPTILNGNCQSCNPNSVDCMMKSPGVYALCAYTPQQIGWPVIPNAPSNLTATAGSNSVVLKWTDASNNESGFKIERKTGTSGTWSQITTVGQNSTTYTNSSVSPGTYCYRVRAYNSAGVNSLYSNEVCATVTATSVTIFSENFESAFPSSRWIVGDANGSNGYDYWDDQSASGGAKVHGGSLSAYCADISDIAGQYYDDYMQAYFRLAAGVNVANYQNVTLSFWIWNNSESGYDYLRRYYSSDGQNWTKSTVEWTGNSNGWKQYSFTLTGFTNYWIKFEFYSDGSVHNYEGAYIDDITITGTPITTSALAKNDAAVEIQPHEKLLSGEIIQVQALSKEQTKAESLAKNTALPEFFDLAQSHPNPFNPETAIRYQMPQAGQVTLRVYNMLGEEVVTLQQGYMEAGHHQVTWNGKSGQGKEVASGTYLYRLEVKAANGERFVATRKMNLLR